MSDIRKLIDIINENTVAGSVAGNELGFASGGIGSKPQRRVKESESQVEEADDKKSRFANAPKQDKVTAPNDLSTPNAPATTESAPQQEVGASASTPKVIEYGNWENSALVTSSKVKQKRSKKKVSESQHRNLKEFDSNIDADTDLDFDTQPSYTQPAPTPAKQQPSAASSAPTTAKPSTPFISAAPDTDTKAVQIPPTAAAIAKQGGFDPNKIQVGQKIPLPDGSTHTVKPGDTLSKILSSYNTKQETLPLAKQPQPKLVPGRNPDITQPQRASAATTVAAKTGTDKNELMNIIGAAETGANPDLSFGDVIDKDGNIRSTLGKGKDGKPLVTTQSMFGKPLSALSVGEVQQYQAARSKQKSGTGAVGAYQFMPGTLNAYVEKLGIDPSEPFNLETQQKIQQAIMNDNASTLKRAGIDQTPTNMYMAHYVGPSGAVAVNRAAAQNPNMPVAEVLARQQLGDAASDPQKLSRAMANLTKFNPNLKTPAGSFSSMIDKTLQDRTRTYQTRVASDRKAPAVTESNELTEQDLIINPAAIKRISGLISKDHDRRDHEVGMARSDLYQAAQNAQKVFMLLRDTSEDEGIEGWVQEKIIKAADYLNTIREYLEGRELGISESELDEAGLWDNIRKRQASGKPARKPGEKGAPDAKTWRKVKALGEEQVDYPVPIDAEIINWIKKKYPRATMKQFSDRGWLADKIREYHREPKVLAGIRQRAVDAGRLDNVAEGRFIFNRNTGAKLHPKTGKEMPKKEKPPASSLTVSLQDLEKNRREKPHQSPFTTQDEKVARYLKAAQKFGSEQDGKTARHHFARGMANDDLSKFEESHEQDVAEGLADDFLKMAREKNPKARISTAVQRKGEAEKLAKEREHLKTVHADPTGNPRPLGDYDPKSGRSYSRESIEDVAEGVCSECGGPAFSEEAIAEAKDACYNKVKSRYKVWPSAYASGALVKCRKVGAKNWGNKSKKK